MINHQPLSLLLIPKIGNVSAIKTLNLLDWKPEKFTDKDFVEMLQSINFKKIDYIKSTLENAKLLIEKYNKDKINLISFFEEGYPKKYRKIKNPPLILYYKGNLKNFMQSTNIAIIGTRKPTLKASRFAFDAARIVAQNSYSVISGLALGCDTAAHKGCLDANGKTMAILPSSVDQIYPVSNQDLANSILGGDGCLISEYPPNSKVINSNFIQRDRLQSGISDIVMVIETNLDGGTMHTVNYAIEQNVIIACFDNYNETDNVPLGNKKILNMQKTNKLKSLDDILILLENLPKLQKNSEAYQGNLF
ncbi:DNA-protecting protein DprA [Alphaproteobacteria bacterium]|nr:DNA-protecting protein DprA [Alphaproteobacteria bacterium]